MISTSPSTVDSALLGLSVGRALSSFSTLLWPGAEADVDAEVRAWVRPAEGGDPAAFFLLAAVDVLPATVFELGLPGYVPTLELTVHVRARPAAGWLRVTHASRNLAGGYLEEDAEVWDCTGRVVAQSRQLARAPRAADAAAVRI